MVYFFNCTTTNDDGHTRCDQKITVILKFRELHEFNFAFFCVVLVHMSIHILAVSAILLVSLFLTDKIVSGVLV